MRAAVSYLQHEWSHLPLRRIGVAELAKAAHVSRGYLNRLFQKTFGSSASVALERPSMFTRRSLGHTHGYDHCGNRSPVRLRGRGSLLSPVPHHSRHVTVRVPQPLEPAILCAGAARRAATEPAHLGSVISRAANRQTVPGR